jgi:hypothetical protein
VGTGAQIGHTLLREIEIPDWVEDFDDLREWGADIELNEDQEWALAFYLDQHEGLEIFDDIDELVEYLEKYDTD